MPDKGRRQGVSHLGRQVAGAVAEHRKDAPRLERVGGLWERRLRGNPVPGLSRGDEAIRLGRRGPALERLGDEQQALRLAEAPLRLLDQVLTRVEGRDGQTECEETRSGLAGPTAHLQHRIARHEASRVGQRLEQRSRIAGPSGVVEFGDPVKGFGLLHGANAFVGAFV